MPNNNNADSIYSRLLDGESEEAIAQAFLDALNEAKDRYAAEKAAEEAKAAEAREKAEREKAKREDMKGLIVDFLYFIAHYYPAFGIEAADVDMLDDDTLNALADFLILKVSASLPRGSNDGIFIGNTYRIPAGLGQRFGILFGKDPHFSHGRVFF